MLKVKQGRWSTLVGNILKGSKNRGFLPKARDILGETTINTTVKSTPRLFSQDAPQFPKSFLGQFSVFRSPRVVAWLLFVHVANSENIVTFLQKSFKYLLFLAPGLTINNLISFTLQRNLIVCAKIRTTRLRENGKLLINGLRKPRGASWRFYPFHVVDCPNEQNGYFRPKHSVPGAQK